MSESQPLPTLGRMGQAYGDQAHYGHCLKSFVKLTSVSGNAGETVDGIRLQVENHKHFIRNCLPLASDAVFGSFLEAEAWIVFRVAQDDDEGAASFPEDPEPFRNEPGADPSPLALRQNSHGRQPPGAFSLRPR